MDAPSKQFAEVIPARMDLLPSFRDALEAVAREGIYVEMVDAPAMDRLESFFRRQSERGCPQWFAVESADAGAAGRVVGWCDISPSDNPRTRHRGSLGMGVIAGMRGRGIGSRLLAAALESAGRSGIEKVELHVYTSNLPAIALYRKFGFVEEGLIRDYRRYNGERFDCLAMAKFV